MKKYKEFRILLQRIAQSFPVHNPYKVIRNYCWYFSDLFRYAQLDKEMKRNFLRLYPQIYDKTSITQVDPLYFYQDTWAARKIFESKPAVHVDIGSTALLVGILSQFTKVCSVEIRPINIRLDNLEIRFGSITNLPFEDQELYSVSSLCVIEHIGLGRYGDALDKDGSFKAASELQRVLARGGNLYISTEIGEDLIYFNSHRTFSLSTFLSMFNTLHLVEARFIQGNNVYNVQEFSRLDPKTSQTFGLFHFRRE